MTEATRPQTAAAVRSPEEKKSGGGGASAVGNGVVERNPLIGQALSPQEQFEAQKKLAQERGRQRAIEREAKRRAEVELAAANKKKEEEERLQREQEAEVLRSVLKSPLYREFMLEIYQGADF
jgi:hypothetical protein